MRIVAVLFASVALLASASPASAQDESPLSCVYDGFDGPTRAQILTAAEAKTERPEDQPLWDAVRERRLGCVERFGLNDDQSQAMISYLVGRLFHERAVHELEQMNLDGQILDKILA